MFIPEIGHSIQFDGVNWIVVAIGEKKFEYESDKGIFAFVNLDDMECVSVLIRVNKVKIIVDPLIPSITADGNELLNGYGNPGLYVLLEFDKNNN
ncbi:MAG: hypothetical protein ACFFAS_00890 [Promethearchaeota archaeon]